MAQGIDLKTVAYRYAKNSIIAFIEGGKYARDKKPRNIAWLVGVIRESGVSKDELAQILSELESHPMGAEEKSRFTEAKQKTREMV